MKLLSIAAFCCKSFLHSVEHSSGVTPTTFPPTTVGNFDPKLLTGHGLLYFKLHGLQNQPFWYGDGFITAIKREHITAVDLTGTVVYLANCWTTDNEGQHSPMLSALLQSGAKAVIGGPGENYCLSSKRGGVDLLGQVIRQGLQVGFPPNVAFLLGRARLTAQIKNKVTKDTLGFKIFTL